jgi:hypothetical protein
MKRNHNVDITIAIGHSGLERDRSIADAVGGDLDLIVGGHSHTLMWNAAQQGEWPRSNANPNLRGPVAIYPTIQNDVAIVHAASGSRYLGGVDIIIEDAANGADPPTIVFSPVQAFLKGSPDDNTQGEGDGVVLDPEALALIDRLEVGVQAWRASVIGNFSEPLSNALESSSQVGGLVCDAMIHDAKATYDMDVDFAVFPSGHIRGNGLAAGGLNFSDVVHLFPEGLSTAVVQVTGRDLYAVLEHSVANLPNNTQGEFLQVGGFTFTFKRIAAAECGLGESFARPCNRFSEIRRVQTVLNKRSEVIRRDDSDTFKLVITNQLLAQVYGYKIFGAVPVLLENGSPVDVVVANFLKASSGQYAAGVRAVDETPDWVASGLVPDDFPMGRAFMFAVVIFVVVLAYVCVFARSQDSAQGHRHHVTKADLD